MASVSTPIEVGRAPPKRFRANPRLDRLFFSALAVLMLATVFVGFAQSYYLYGIIPLPRWKHGFAPPHPAIVHVHGLVLSAWFILLLVQTSLVSARRLRVHRRLGIAGVVLAVFVVLVGFAVVCEHMARAFAPGDPKIAGHAGGSFTTVFDLIIFAVLIAVAFLYRHRPAIHKRLIMIGSLGLLPPALMRAPPIHGSASLAFDISYGVLIAMMLFDVASRRKVHPATLCGAVLYVALRNEPLNAVLSANTGWWLALATQAQSLGHYFY